MARNTTHLEENFAKNLFTHSRQRLPQYTHWHPMIPERAVPEWKTDMKNRTLILQNADLGQSPHYEHDENLFLAKREQLSYNVEDRIRVHSRVEIPTRYNLLRPSLHEPNSRFMSSLRWRFDSPEVKMQKD